MSDGDILWFIKDLGDSGWMTVAVEVDPVSRNGNVLAFADGPTEADSKRACAAMLKELTGRSDEPADVPVWRDPAAGHQP